MTAIATTENIAALILPTLSPKLSRPTASPPRTTVKWSHDRKVRSLANDTFGSTLMGSAMRLDAVRWRRGWVDILSGCRHVATVGSIIITFAAYAILVKVPQLPLRGNRLAGPGRPLQ